MNGVIRFKSLAPLFVLALSLVTATATTTNVIFSFEGDNGEYADTDLETDGAGNIYGTTVLGGDHGSGTVFQLSPTHSGWVQTVLYSFIGGADGSSGSAGRMFLNHSRLYGAATTGGTYGSGVVFELTPTAVGEWDFRTLYSFHGQPDGSFPYGALLRAASGKLYGTTYYGGRNGIGSV